MTVASFNIDDLFIIRTKKNLLTNPDNSWVNSYEFRAIAAGSSDELISAALIVVAFERLLHAPGVRFSQFTLSTWQEDSVPYDPEAFISVPISDVGERNKAVDLLPLNQTWGVTRVPTTGRFGHLFLRGCLYEDDVNAPAGKQVFSNLLAISGDLAAAVTTSGLTDLVGAGARGPLQMVMINKTGTQIRPVAGLSVGGVSAVPQDHKWFNRTRPSGPL